jgi:hypothetical protein
MFGKFFLRMISLCDWGFAKAAKTAPEVVLPPLPPLAKIGDLA